MAIEHARTRIVHKPWGSTDLRPWADNHDNAKVGELWFQRADMNAPSSSLLLKLLFTDQPLSIQVHPGDAFAQSRGWQHGKSEAWYVLSATPEAKIAIGLKRQLTALQLRASIEDGTISDAVQWRRVLKDELIYVPAGTIHAVGAGLVLAEIQQRSDTTFRLFDHGRQRELHVDNAVAVATAGPAEGAPAPYHLTDARTLLVASPHFVLERLDLPANSEWELNAEHETWFLVLEGQGRIGTMNSFVGEAIFLDADRTDIVAGASGLQGLVAYLGPEVQPALLINLHQSDDLRVLPSLRTGPPNRAVAPVGAQR